MQGKSLNPCSRAGKRAFAQGTGSEKAVCSYFTRSPPLLHVGISRPDLGLESDWQP